MRSEVSIIIVKNACTTGYEKREAKKDQVMKDDF
jgi:hypothetical protein